eukprot:2560677-Lingulodinium_polyedra.AAC.1
MDPAVVRRRRAEARTLLAFVAEIYGLQLKAGRHFVHEHPEGATSWNEKCMQDILNDPRVSTVVGRQCQYGLATPGPDGVKVPARKATRFASSAPEILRKLDKQCKGEHAHQHLVGGRAAAAARYPAELCKALLRGIDAQRRREGRAMPKHVEERVNNGC